MLIVCVNSVLRCMMRGVELKSVTTGCVEGA